MGYILESFEGRGRGPPEELGGEHDWDSNFREYSIVQRRPTLTPSTDRSVCGDRRSLHYRELQAPVSRLQRSYERPLGAIVRCNGERVFPAAYHHSCSGEFLCSILGDCYQCLLVSEFAHCSHLRTAIDTRARVVSSVHAGHK